MTKDTIFSLLRSALTIVGSILLGKNIFGTAVDNSVIEAVIGGALFVGSVVWGIADKTATIEMLQSALLKVVMFGGGLLVASGKLKGNTLETIAGIIPILAPILYKFLSRKKSQEIASGALPVSNLKGVSGPITPVR